jgi:hypothetical protein
MSDICHSTLLSEIEKPLCLIHNHLNTNIADTCSEVVAVDVDRVTILKGVMEPMAWPTSNTLWFSRQSRRINPVFRDVLRTRM